MTQWELPNELRPVLKRLAWFEPLRSEAAFDPILFLQLAMAYASQSELDQIRQHFPVEEFRTALRQAPPGLFDRQSWRYWHQALGLGEAGPLPKRPFLPDNWEQDDRFSKCVIRG
jgi:hypothetical protein